MTQKSPATNAHIATALKPSVHPMPARRTRRPKRISRREAQEAAARIQTGLDGKRIFLRFTLGQRIEHQLLIVSFTILAVTGLPQRFANTAIGALALQLLGGIETARQIHHLFAAVFIIESIYHVGLFMYNLVVHGRWGAIWPNLDDMRHFIQMLRLNFGLSKEHLQFGRYTFEEKMEYWALVWGGVVMIATGFIQWFPMFITRWLPGAVIPIARAFHGWEAILAVLAILTWHAYHAVFKHFNKSIFTGYMTEEEMREEHPAELEYLERAAAIHNRHAMPPSPVVQQPSFAPKGDRRLVEQSPSTPTSTSQGGAPPISTPTLATETLSETD